MDGAVSISTATVTLHVSVQRQDVLSLSSLLHQEQAAPLLAALKRRTVKAHVPKGGSARLQVVAKAPGKSRSLFQHPG